MYLLSVILAVVMVAGPFASPSAPGTSSPNSGTPSSSSSTTPPDNTDARSHIIDIG
ncbi:MAG TPA: hypothetical protein VLL54_02315 [Pyrinomonadaceae bacterium]|nr:hypothetical protein [Pyrinomonadaceae bacterium]